MHDIKKNIPGTDAHAMHNPTRGTGDEGVKNAVKVCLDLHFTASVCQQFLLHMYIASPSVTLLYAQA